MAIARILLVDDEQDLVWALRYSLSDEGYEVLTAGDGLEGIALAQRCRPDLIILDIVMPRLDGIQVCRKLRRDPELAAVPILFLTVRSTAVDRVRGLDEGADDYLTKPFDLGELKARIRAQLRRRRRGLHPISGERKRDRLIVHSLELDLNTYQVRLGDKTVPTTQAEFDILHYLMTHPGQVFSSQQLLRQVWGYPQGSANPGLVRWHIMNLRTKLESDPHNPVYIRTIPHRGYILDDGELPPPADSRASQSQRNGLRGSAGFKV